MLATAVFAGVAKQDNYDIDVCVSLDIFACLTAWTSAAFLYAGICLKKDEWRKLNQILYADHSLQT